MEGQHELRVLLVEAELVLHERAVAEALAALRLARMVALGDLADAVVHQLLHRGEVAVERRARHAGLLHELGDRHLRPVLAAGELHERGQQPVFHLSIRELPLVHETHPPVLSRRGS